MRITMLSTFGPEVRGISYYSDCLLAALNALDELQIKVADYDRIYPAWLHPAAKIEVKSTENRTVHYARPWTWRLDQRNTDLIHLQAWTSITSLIHLRILRSARQQGIPTVLTLHNPIYHEQSGLLGRLQKSCLKLVDCIVLHDECGVAAIPADCQHKIRIIPHGTETLPIDEQQLRQVDQEQPYLLYFGNIRPYKGIELLVSAWQQCVAQCPTVRLVVAGQLWKGNNLLSRFSAHLLGTAKYSRIIQRLAGDTQLQRVEFRLEFIDDQQLDELIRGARYTIFPYLKFSGHSGAVARSAANGTPVLVSNVGGLPTLAISPDNVFPAGDQQALSELLVRKLKPQAIDFEERNRQLNKAHEFSWTRVAALHRDLYRDLLLQSGSVH